MSPSRRDARAGGRSPELSIRNNSFFPSSAHWMETGRRGLSERVKRSSSLGVGFPAHETEQRKGRLSPGFSRTMRILKHLKGASCFLSIAEFLQKRTLRLQVVEGSPSSNEGEDEVDSLPNLTAVLDKLFEEVDEAVKEEPADLRTRLALVESEVHKFEQRIDGVTAADLAKSHPPPGLSEEEARAEKKSLLRRSEQLLENLDQIFQELKRQANTSS